jgi:hypothetical protein
MWGIIHDTAKNNFLNTLRARSDSSPRMDHEDHPRGTLLIVSVFGGLVLLGWLLMFFGLFVPRGTH